MKLQLLRNATMKIEYGGKVLLTDPMLSEPGAIRSFAGKARNPTVPLPVPPEEIPRGVDAVLVSHLHPDHFDEAAAELLPDTQPVICQPRDTGKLAKLGFSSCLPVPDTLEWEGLRITRTGGRHGRLPLRKLMGQVSGFVLQAPNEPTVYWIGDSILCRPVRKAIRKYRPDIIITHSGGARLLKQPPIVMDARQTVETVRLAPEARVVAVHIESLDHCEVSRSSLREAARTANIPDEQLLIPADGESVTLDR